MPTITAETPREQNTIAGEIFSVAQPYAEGHTLTANEASALNQTYAENIRNNFASKVKEAKEAGTFDLEVFQGSLNDYMDEYEFGKRTGGGRTTDPVMAEAMNIARQLVREAIRKQGLTLADYSAATISENAKALVSKNPTILEQAKARVEAANALTVDVELDLGEPEAAAEDAPAKGRKAKAEAEVVG